MSNTESVKVTVFWEHLKNLHEQFVTKAIEIFNNGGDVTPQLFMVEMSDSGEIHHMAGCDPHSMHMLMSDETGKEMFAAFIRDMFDAESPVRIQMKEQKFNPNVMIQINEAWMSMDASFSKPQNDPERKECVLVTIHTEFGSIPVMHFIEDKPKRHVVKEEFPDESVLGSYKGRFAIEEVKASDKKDKPLH